MKRIVIYPTDIMLLTGKSETYARKEIRNIKQALKKQQHQKVTLKEYCHYYGLMQEFEEICQKLQNK